MNPTRLRLQNFRSFQHLDLPLPDGVCAIVGENGAGKSTIVSAIDLSLFGPETRSWAPYLTEGIADTEMMVELEFDHAGATYRVRRSFSARGRGQSKVDLEHLDEQLFPAAWVSLTLGDAKATQGKLDEILGMTRRTLRASSLLLQGDGAAFTEADPRERKAILAEILGLQRFDQLLALVRTDRRTVEDEIQKITGALESADTELAARSDLELRLRVARQMIDEATRDCEKAERREGDIVDWLAKVEILRAQLQAAIAEQERAADRLGVLKRQRDAWVEAVEEIDRCRTQIAIDRNLTPVDRLEQREADLRTRAQAYDAAVAAHEQAKREAELKRTQREAIEGRASSLRADATLARYRVSELAAAGPGTEHCPTCQQTLGAEALASTIAALATQADELDAAARDLDAQAADIELPQVPAMPTGDRGDTDLRNVSQQLREARERLLQSERLNERIAALEKIEAPSDDELGIAAAEHAAKQLAVNETRDLLLAQAEIETLEHEQRAVRMRIQEERQRGQTATADQARTEAQLERLAEIEQHSQAHRQRRDFLHADLDLIAILERAYGRDGIPALIVENSAIPQIEVEACRILAEFGTPYRIELRTERALKSGDGTRDTLDVVVLTETGERPYETFSGGERTRINLAVRIALARLLASRRGAESKLLAIDEPEFLDEQGTAALARVLGELREFDRVWLVSHVPGLRDSFDQTLTVVKDGDRSRVEGATETLIAEAEAVA